MSHYVRTRSEWILRLAEEARFLGDARMLRDDQELTPELEAAIIKRVKDYMQRGGKSQQALASALAISSATLSELLGGGYRGDVESMIRKIDKGLEQLLLKEAAPKVPGFVTTEAAKQMIGLAKRLHRIGGIGVITGPSGCGKSMTAEYLRSEIVGSILIRVTTAGASKSAVLDMIARQLRVAGLSLTAYQVEQQVHHILKSAGGNRMLIIDEAHKLIIKRRDEGLHCLRDLHDETECPILLIGTSNLKSYIMDGASNFEALDQISGRSALWLNLTEQLTVPGDSGGGGTLHSVDDIRKFLTKQQVRLVKDQTDKVADDEIAMTTDAVLYLRTMANEPCGGCMRTVKWLVLLARDVYPAGSVVDAAMLDGLQEGRIGKASHRAQSQRRAIDEARRKRTA